MGKHRQPRWWSNIIRDLEMACQESKKSFMRPFVVIGTTEEDDTMKVTGYIIRLPGGEAGYYPAYKLGKKNIPVGSKIKKGSELPEPEFLVKEPNRESFILKTTRGQVKLIHPMWLHKTITAIVAGRKDQITGSDKDFTQWVKLPPVVKGDKEMMAVIKKEVEKYGLLGLAKFNILSK